MSEKTTTTAPQPEVIEQDPAAGGSYIRQADGSLKQVAVTKAPQPRAATEPPAPAAAA